FFVNKNILQTMLLTLNMRALMRPIANVMGIINYPFQHRRWKFVFNGANGHLLRQIWVF
uniref:Uncharacterized protein n=1 Tax=Oryza brachyantha TaxID=4533 RepID=J3L6U0_ORYBR